MVTIPIRPTTTWYVQRQTNADRNKLVQVGLDYGVPVKQCVERWCNLIYHIGMRGARQ